MDECVSPGQRRVRRRSPSVDALMSAVAALVVTALVVTAGCAASDGAGTPGSAPAAPLGGPTAATQPDDPSTRVPGTDPATPRAGHEVARWGEGRAVAALHDDESGRLVVATTIGFATVEPGSDAGGFVEAANGSSGSPTAFDARHVAIVDHDGRLGVVDVTADAPGDASAVDPHESDRDIQRLDWSADGDLVTSAAAAVTVVRLDDGVRETVVTAPAQASLGTPAFDRSATTFVVAVTAPTGTTLSIRREQSSLDEIPISESPEARLFDVGISPDGRTFAVARSVGDDPFDAELAIGDTSTGTITDVLPLPSAGRSGSTWAIGSDRLVLVGTSSGFELHEVDEQGSARMVGGAETAPLASVLATSDRFVTSHADGNLRLWTTAGEEIALLATDSANVVGLRMSTGGSTLSAVAIDGTIRRWSSIDGEPSDTVDRFAAGRVNSVAISSDGSTAAASTDDGEVRLIDLEERTQSLLAQMDGSVDSVAISPATDEIAAGVGERLGEGSFDDTVAVWEMSSGTTRHSFGGEGESVPGCAFFTNRVAFSPDGRMLATSSHDFVISIWDVADGTLVERLPAHPSSIHDLAFSPDGTMLASSSDGSDLRIWSVEHGTVVAELATTPGGYWALAFHPDGETLAVSDISGVVSLIDVADGSTRATFTGQKERSSNLAMSPDGSLLAAGAGSGGVLVWSIASGRVVAELVGHDEPVRSVAFTHDGAQVLSGSADSTVRLWAIDQS